MGGTITISEPRSYDDSFGVVRKFDEFLVKRLDG